MKNMLKGLRLAALLGALSCSTLATAEEASALSIAIESITTDELKKHVEFLASDTLQGREAGTVGNHAAGAYLVGELKKTALKPAGDSGEWFQYFNANMRNILGALPGSDETLKDEWIVVGAHYDHVGFGAPNNSRGPIGFVHNGADDNASGTTALLEIIEALSESQLPLRRSVLFAFWDGEEKGLLGSRHFVANPLKQLERLKLAMHADMVGRLGPSGMEITGWRTGTGLRQWIAQQNAVGQKLDFNLRYIGESDHWPFFESGVPSLMLHTGKHEDYHRPSDDTERINFKGLRIATELLLRLTIEAANADSLPSFREASRAELHEINAIAKSGGISRTPTVRPTRLGIHFDPEAEKQQVIKLVRVVTGSPAEQGGLRVGDEIVEFNGSKLSDASRFGTLVITAPREVAIKVRRGEATESLKVTLGAEPVRVGLELRSDDAEPGVPIVSEIVSQSPAHRAGLLVGDRVLQVGLDDTSGDAPRVAVKRSNAEILELLAAAKEPIELLIERDGKLETISFRPAETFAAATTSDE